MAMAMSCTVAASVLYAHCIPAPVGAASGCVACFVQGGTCHVLTAGMHEHVSLLHADVMDTWVLLKALP